MLTVASDLEVIVCEFITVVAPTALFPHTAKSRLDCCILAIAIAVVDCGFVKIMAYNPKAGICKYDADAN